MVIKNIIGLRIKYLRIKLKMSQKDLAKKSNLSSSAIQQFEDFIRKPSNEALERIANALNTSVDFLTGKSGFINNE